MTPKQREAIAEARKRWGACCLLGPTTEAPSDYWFDSFDLREKRVKERKILDKLDKKLFSKALKE